MSQRLRTGNRGLAVQVGVTILLGFIVIAIATYQVQVVPQQNARVEFSHSQTVQGELQTARGAIVSSIGGSTERSSSIQLGTTYPSRTIFLNPPPPSGQLQTTDPANLTIKNATTVNGGETGDFWDGTTYNISTRALTYQPAYNEYQSGPTTVIDNTVVFDRQPRSGTAVIDTGQRVVENDRISIIGVQGDYQKASIKTVTLETRAVSTSDRVVTVTGDGGPITITLPTQLSATQWDDLFSDEENVVRVTDAGPGRVTVALDGEETYKLQMARIGLTNSVEQPGPRYITTVEGNRKTTQSGESQQLVAEIRDQYNNPVSGVRANASLRDPSKGTVTAISNISDAEGRVLFDYEPSASATGSTAVVEVNFSASPSPRQQANFSVSVSSGSSSSTYSLQWNTTQIESQEGVLSCNGTTCTYDIGADVNSKFTAAINTTPPETGVNVDYTTDTPTVISGYNPEAGVTDSVGEATTEVTVTGAGVANMTVAAISATDRLRLEVNDSSSGGGGGAASVQYVGGSGQAAKPSGPSETGVQFDIESTGSAEAVVTAVTVNNTDTSATAYRVSSNGDGEFEREAFFDVTPPSNRLDDPEDGYAEATSISIGTSEPLDNLARVPSGDTATVTLYEFVDGSGTPVEMTGSSVTVTVEYEPAGGGTTETTTFIFTAN